MKKKTILVINPKGGSGKTTLSTNLASYYAVWEVPVALADYDQQQSSSFWHSLRPQYVSEDGQSTESDIKLTKSISPFKGDRYYKRIIVDAPARTTDHQTETLIKAADKIIIPVLPSPIDIHAAERFLEQIDDSVTTAKKNNIALVANRCKMNTLSFNELNAYLQNQKVKFVAALRDSQNYNRAFELGLGIFDFAPSYVATDTGQWIPLLNWLEE